MLTFSSCSEYGLSPTEQSSEPPLQGIVDFLMYDNGGGGYEPNGLTHTIEVGKTFYARARTNDPSIVAFTWTFGDGNSGQGRDILHSYTDIGLFNICVTGWRSDSTYVTFCDQMNVVISTSNANPVVTQISSTPVSGGRYKIVLEYRKRSSTDYTTCGWDTSRAAIYNTGKNMPWVTHRHISDTIFNGNMIDTIRVANGDTLKWGFGGRFSGGVICYANMAPSLTPPQTSRFWHDDSNPANRGLWARVHNGNLVPFDSIIAVPGPVGDNIVRLGRSPTNQDSVRFYMNGAYCFGSSGSYQWANNITGLTVAKNLSDVHGFSGWKMGVVHKNQILALLNSIVQFKYGRPLSSLASYEGCMLYNPDNGLLEVVVIEIGNSIQSRPVLRMIDKKTGEIVAELDLS
ncbi:PKD domain-containing protein [Candidatus Falkowbacteria bacterium]|nr:MAG: PKD domain-containing protein [Candidatus Falkowbacteria bacterium]